MRQRAWGAAFRELCAADQETPLEPQDLEALAEAAHLLGKQAAAADLLTRAHHGFLAAGDAVAAVRCAFWLAFGAQAAGEHAQAGGWLSRARRMLDDGHHDCVERGYLDVVAAIRAFGSGDAAGAHAAFLQVGEVGGRFRDPDLKALALCGQGRSLIRSGAMTDGQALLDETMVAVQAGEVSPRIAGGIYCTMLEACDEILDLRRAQEWTTALERWCSAQPDLVTFRGPCLLRRAEILLLHGAWPEALAEARRAVERFSQPRPGPEAGLALQILGEVHRLRGELGEAEDAYRRASQWERVPKPGFALLRLAQGQLEAARAAIQHVAEVIREGGDRARVLDAWIEIDLAAGAVPSARGAADELSALARRLAGPFLRALSTRAVGAVLVAEGDAPGGLAALRESLATWRELEAPYESARTQMVLARACRANQRSSAALELEGARRVFERLGAALDVARIDTLLRQGEARGGLTAREVQVLAQVASGRTNRAIAQELGLSEKTVAPHLSNIFVKLDVSSRSAATAYAFQHDLL